MPSRDVADELRLKELAILGDEDRAALLEHEAEAARDRRDLADGGLVVVRVVGDVVLDGADAEVEEALRGLALVRDVLGLEALVVVREGMEREARDLQGSK